MTSRQGNPSPSPPSARTSLFSTSSADTPSPPFYNTTFSAHRVSPLHLGTTPLTSARLHSLAQRLRDTLVGDVVRGVEVGLDGEDHVMGRAGALEAVQVRWLRVRDVLECGEGRGLSFEVRYEAAVCMALLLPAPSGEEGEEGFLEMPLLLMRMPAPLKTVVGEFLETAFDCRVSALRLGTRSMVRAWEAWIAAAGLPTRGPLARDLVLSLGFYVPPAERDAADEQEAEAEAKTDQPLGLKSIEVFIPAVELRKFVDAGSSDSTQQSNHKTEGNWGWEDDPKKRRRLAGRLREEGWGWRASTNTEGDDGASSALGEQPFTEALGRYLDQHLGLNLFHPGVRIIKIACGGFVISESRLKVFAPANLGEAAEGDDTSSGQRGAVWELLRGLVDKAQARDSNR
ncbi:kinetochore complex Sim4 subunit Fta1-domain-containing protein [Lasiosphaeria hispida]|uniref:Kinetochore complex Sim4 subunit Fta1-domain-containing protein n=1 Tax=Lasiosphaeria hispida TaxID=260671 RepID=A0AAJ0HK34_9PEZI|nr:kinetochore complex Sim4 subunit Fta1-domain-containing protein [Lasiosphaeria hispida]